MSSDGRRPGASGPAGSSGAAGSFGAAGPGATGTTDITWLRVLLVADVLARAAETRDKQALTAFVLAGEASAQGDVLVRPGHDPLAMRLALMSVPYHQPAELTSDTVASAEETVTGWRRQVTGWAESPSSPVPARIAEALWSAFGDLDTVAALAVLPGLTPDGDIPAGTKFERRFDASPRRATPKGHKSFIFHAAPHRTRSPT